MRPAERLVSRLRAEGVEIPDGWRLRRTYAGRLQRSTGAWSWFIEFDGREIIGGYLPVKTLAAASTLCVSSSVWQPRVLEVDAV